MKTEENKQEFKPEFKPEKSQTKKQILDDIIKKHKQIIERSNDIMVSNNVEPCFQYIVNTSGNKLILADFQALSKDPESQRTFQLLPGEKLNLLTKFDIKDINRNRQSLLTAASNPGMFGLPALTFVDNFDIKFPVSLVKETMYEKGMKMIEDTGESVRIVLPENEFDVAYRQELQKEEKRNKKIEEMSGIKVPEKRKSRADLEQEMLNK